MSAIQLCAKLASGNIFKQAKGTNMNDQHALVVLGFSGDVVVWKAQLMVWGKEKSGWGVFK
jgi:hypothetical protein